MEQDGGGMRCGAPCNKDVYWRSHPAEYFTCTTISPVMHNTDLPRWLIDLLSVAPDLAREIPQKKRCLVKSITHPQRFGIHSLSDKLLHFRTLIVDCFPCLFLLLFSTPTQLSNYMRRMSLLVVVCPTPAFIALQSSTVAFPFVSLLPANWQASSAHAWRVRTQPG